MTGYQQKLMTNETTVKSLIERWLYCRKIKKKMFTKCLRWSTVESCKTKGGVNLNYRVSNKICPTNPSNRDHIINWKDWTKTRLFRVLGVDCNITTTVLTDLINAIMKDFVVSECAFSMRTARVCMQINRNSYRLCSLLPSCTLNGTKLESCSCSIFTMLRETRCMAYYQSYLSHIHNYPISLDVV